METSNTADTQLPQTYLDSQFCSECFQYLTVPPIKVTRKGTICGCHEDLMLSDHFSQINIVLKKFQFPCINRYDGCSEVLNFSISKQHEKSCKSVQRKCEFCSFKGNWCQILCHVSKQHSLNLTKTGRFSFKVGSEWKQIFMYPIEKDIYIFTVDLTQKKLKIIISAKTEPDYIVDHFTLKFSRSSDFLGKHVISEYGFFCNTSKAYCEKEVDELNLLFGLNQIVYCQIVLETVTLSEKELEVDKKINFINDIVLNLAEKEKTLNELQCNIQKQLDSSEGLLNLCKRVYILKSTCSICNCVIISDIYFCSKLHSCCINCVSLKCKGCNDFTNFAPIKAFNKIIVTCDWPQCQKSLRIFDYLEHRSNCQARPYKCPDPRCLEVLYSILNLRKHWHYEGTSISTSDILEFKEYGNYNIFWCIQGDLYFVSVKFSDTFLQIIIENSDVAFISMRFKVSGKSSGASIHQGFNSGYVNFTSGEFQINGKFSFCNQNYQNGIIYTSIKISYY